VRGDPFELVDRARRRMEGGALDEAVALLRLSAEKGAYSGTYELLGECLAKLGRNEEAVMPLAAAMALDRRSNAPTLLAEVLLALERYEHALKAAGEALKRAPDDRRAAAVQRKATGAKRARKVNTFEMAEALYYLGALCWDDLDGFIPDRYSSANNDSLKRAFEPFLWGRSRLDREAAWRQAATEIARAILDGPTSFNPFPLLVHSRVYDVAGKLEDLRWLESASADWFQWMGPGGAEFATKVRAEAERWIGSHAPPPGKYTPLGAEDYQEPPAGPAVRLHWEGYHRPRQRLGRLVDKARHEGWRVHAAHLANLDDLLSVWNLARADVVLERGTTDAEAEDFLLWAEQAGTRRGVLIRRAETVYEQRPTSATRIT
jgi:tetratricopeptide (TPR) repeat protein